MKNIRVVSDLSSLTPVGAHLEVVVADSAVSLLTAAQVQLNARYALIQARGADLTYVLDGASTPAADGPGFVLANGNSVILRKETVLKIKCIRNAGTNVDVQVQWLD